MGLELTILLGILSSVAAEIVTAINKKLTGTVLEGDGAFLLAFGLSIVGAGIAEVMTPGFTLASLLDWPTLVARFSEAFAISQLFFVFITKKLNLDVTHSSAIGPAAPATTATTAQAPMRFAPSQPTI